MSHFSFEFSRMRPSLVPVGLATATLQLLFLYFFALVGRFDYSESSTTLTHASAVLGLATTGTMCVLAIYGTVLASQLLVRDYVGMNKSKTYLLPVSRKVLFYTKTQAFSAMLSVAMLVGLLGANLLFAGFELVLPLTVDQPLEHLGALAASAVACICLTLTIVLLASFIGIKLNATIKAIIASIIFVVFLSNLAAITLMANPLLSLLIAVGLGILVELVGIGIGQGIDRNEAY